MKITSIAILVSTLSILVARADHTNGYTKKDGTYVAPYERSHPDGTTDDNYSHQGNVNPYTGKEGHETGKDKDQP